MTEPFRLTFAPGVTPDKWLRRWEARMPDTPLDATIAEEVDQVAGLRDGSVSMALVRLPVDRDGLHVIPLYREVPVVVAAKDHPIAAFDEIDVTDLADEHLLQDPDEVPAWRDVATEVRDGTRTDVPSLTPKQAVEVAASGAGVVVLPLSVARLYSRKDVVHRPVTGLPGYEIGLAWRVDDEDPRIEVFIGVVRGRSERSSRGGVPAAAENAPASDPGKSPGRRGTSPTNGSRSRSTGARGGRPHPGGRPRGRRRR